MPMRRPETWEKGKEKVIITKTPHGYQLAAWQWDRGYNVRKDFEVSAADLPKYKAMLRSHGFKRV